MSLRLHVIQAITLVLLGTLVIGAVLIYWHSVRKIETEMAAAIAVAGRIARNAIDDFGEISDPRRRLVLLVADYDGDRHVRAALFGSSMNLIATSKWRSPERPAPEWLQKLFSGQPRITIMKLPPQLSKSGRIVLQTDSSNEIAEVWADAKLYLMLIGSFCLAVLLVLYFVLGRALKPLQSLLRGFNEIGQGDRAERVSVSGPLELSQLAHGFNDMSDRLNRMKDGNARLREQLETVQEEERAELARNLHDEISPLLFSVDVDATNVAQIIESHASADGSSVENISIEAREKIKGGAAAIKAAVSSLKTNVKGILVQLRPAGLHALNFKSTIEDLTTFWKARNPKLQFSLSVPEKTWGVKLDSAIQSIVRESLSNAMKHGNPSKIEISIFENNNDQLIVEVGDDGKGLSSNSAGDGLGIIGMRERAVLLGGSLEVLPRKVGRGVVVRARLPLSPFYPKTDAVGDRSSGALKSREEEIIA